MKSNLYKKTSVDLYSTAGELRYLCRKNARIIKKHLKRTNKKSYRQKWKRGE